MSDELAKTTFGLVRNLYLLAEGKTEPETAWFDESRVQMMADEFPQHNFFVLEDD